MRNFAFAICCLTACLVILVGCGKTSGNESEAVQSASSDAVASSTASGESDSADNANAADASDASDASVCSIDADEDTGEMPENDFGVDADSYFTKTYNLKDAENLELIDGVQFVWLAINKARAAVVVVDPDDRLSAKMISAAQKAAEDLNATVYVYEPVREANGASDWSALAKDLASQGITNLDGLKSGTLVTLSKLIVDSQGNPAPVQEVVDNPDGVVDAMETAFSLTCCG